MGPLLAVLILGAEPPPPIAIPAVAPAPRMLQPVTAPDWVRRPTPEEMLKAYPRAALAAHAGGVTTLECMVTEAGRLDGCKVLAEDSGRAEFRAATLKLASKFEMRPVALDGRPVAGNPVRLAVRWTPPGGLKPGTPAPLAVIAHPDWLRRPNGDDLGRYFPPNALEKGVDGHAAIECTVLFDGTLSECHVLSEAPEGAGFGRATLRTASRFKMRPQTMDGVSVSGAYVVIPVAWKVTPDTPPPDPNAPLNIGPPPPIEIPKQPADPR
jgi:TonB family protein